MNKTKNIIGIAAVAIVVVGGIIFAMKSPSTSTPATGDYGTTGATTSTTTGGTTSTGGTTGATTPKSYTLVEVAAHKDASSCWTTINGSVYDLTAWIAQHPGGEGAILSICGKDGSAAFEGQHGGQGKPEKILATFKIGMLK